MTRRHSIVGIAMLLTLMWSASWMAAQEAKEPRVDVSLVADTAEIVSGKPFRLGVRFEIEDGWHIYWRNPGEAGLATAVDFELPEGLAAGPLEWPLPIAFTQSGGIPGFGYEESVVLASEIRTAEGSETLSTELVRADVSWLACKSVCVLGSAELVTRLSELPSDPIFREWEHRLPDSAVETVAPFSLSTTGGLADGKVTLWLRWNGAPAKIEWFPDPSAALEVGNINVTTRGGLTRIDADVKTRKGVSGSTDVLPSLLVVTGDDGERRGSRGEAC
jgi:thiol:disulfide interchange protein DsbD